MSTQCHGTLGRLGLHPWLEAPRALAPLIDPNVDSCGTVRPHGALGLAHPEAGFLIVGTKSCGRAPHSEAQAKSRGAAGCGCQAGA